MPRPQCMRFVGNGPVVAVFKPAGIPIHALAQVAMTLDEFEALRLADLEGLYQEDAASRMGVSRPTLGRILESARRKVAEALVMVAPCVSPEGPSSRGPEDQGARTGGDAAASWRWRRPVPGAQRSRAIQDPTHKSEEKP